MSSLNVKNKCRVCHGDLFDRPVLVYQNMPAVAQNLPVKEHLSDDIGVDLRIYQCADCGLVQYDGEPVNYYRDVIRSGSFSPEMKNWRAEQFADFVQKYSLKNKKAVEIGCGRGEYLSLLKQSGLDAYGLEHNPQAVKICRENGLKAEEGFVEENDYQINGAPFSAFFILNFLEHLPDPVVALKGINHNLADDAVGVVEVPNFDMMIKESLFSEFMRDHLFYFTKETLNTVLRISGFEVLTCEEVWYDYIISAVVKKRKQIDLSSFNDFQKKLEKDVFDFINRFENKKVAIWGAGHQAFAIMSLLNLSSKICYVVDSADFKQGKYTPASHIPIVSPKQLDLDPAEAVIVMAGSYSDEVVGLLRKKYDQKIKVAVVRSFGLELI